MCSVSSANPFADLERARALHVLQLLKLLRVHVHLCSWCAFYLRPLDCMDYGRKVHKPAVLECKGNAWIVCDGQFNNKATSNLDYTHFKKMSGVSPLCTPVHTTPRQISIYITLRILLYIHYAGCQTKYIGAIITRTRARCNSNFNLN